MKKIYILLSRTNTIPARIIRTFTTGEFSHVSIALSPKPDSFYSYARRRLHNPLIAGFVSEDIHSGVFGQYPDAHCAVYSVEVSDEGYKRAEELISYLKDNSKKATYNFLGTAAMKMGLKVKRKDKYTCSQFCAILLYCTKDVKLPKDPYLMLPNDFLEIDNIELIYDGALENCVITST